jgi:cytochrome oxidase Cu insertion factor (SCO1/SenC/PrrC family)
MTNTARKCALAAGLFTALAVPAIAAKSQINPAAPTTAAAGLAVGDVAPDFSLPGATRYGLLRTPVRLSDFRGRTVVLAFFFQALTKG